YILLPTILTTPTMTYHLSLHDALPIYRDPAPREQLTSLVAIEHAVIDATIAMLAPGQKFALLWSLQVGEHTVAGVQIKERDGSRSEEHTSELQSRENLVCRLLLVKKKK